MTGNGKKMVKDTQNQTMTFDSTGIILYNVYNENDEFSNSSMFVTIIYVWLSFVSIFPSFSEWYFSTFPECGIIIAFICLGNETVDTKFAFHNGYLKSFSQFVIFYKLQKFEKKTDLPLDGFISQRIKEDHRV